MVIFLVASGGPAGGQTFEKFDKQVLKTIQAMPVFSAPHKLLETI